MRSANKELIALYWGIGGMIARQQKTEGWGKSVVGRLAQDLQQEFPGVKGFSVQNLWYMRQFYLEYHGSAKLQPLVGEIAWSNNLIIMSRCKDPMEREFYINQPRATGLCVEKIYRQSIDGTPKSINGSRTGRTGLVLRAQQMSSRLLELSGLLGSPVAR